MLDRVGEEQARATSIVRYAPGSRFPRHSHPGGEEILVLEGVFQDEHGDFPAGSYLRNPPGSAHAPGSEPGCTILVKLRQFDQEDRAQVRLDTNGMDYRPVSNGAGVERMDLFRGMGEEVRLERWPPGQRVEEALPGGMEAFVLAGGFREGSEEFGLHGWLRLPAGEALDATAGPEGCELWVKVGHLGGSLAGE